MIALAFLGAASLSYAAFELLSHWRPFVDRSDRLRGVRREPIAAHHRRPTWQAIVRALLPGRFDPDLAKNRLDVIDLLRRAGYPYSTPGEFYAAALRDFSLFLAVGGLLAGVLYNLGEGVLPGLGLAGLFLLLGLRRPYARLRGLARRRAEAMRSNMLTGLAMLNALITAGVGVQEALRRTAGIGGPFCNLLGLLIARMEVDDFSKAIETAKAHLPDPQDVEAGLFLRDVNDFYTHNRPLLAGLQALQTAVHRNVLEASESRAALVRQRSGLFGVLAVLGLVISILAPFSQVLM